MSTRVRALTLASITAALFLVLVSDLVPLGQWTGISDPISLNVVKAFLVSGMLALGTTWVLFFRSKQKSLFVMSLFPGVAVFPYLLLADSVIGSIFSDIGQVSAGILVSGIYWLTSYLLILTVNVLNGGLLFDIPLGQAGKAAQFIFSLISAYFLIAFLFGSALPLQVRVGATVVFVFYYCFSCIYVLQVPFKEVWMSSLAITMVMGIAVTLLSVWPVGSVYATLAVVVILYIMLSLAIEIREKVGRAIWFEYAFLLILVVIILFTNAEWGINGRLI